MRSLKWSKPKAVALGVAAAGTAAIIGKKRSSSRPSGIKSFAKPVTEAIQSVTSWSGKQPLRSWMQSASKAISSIAPSRKGKESPITATKVKAIAGGTVVTYAVSKVGRPVAKKAGALATQVYATGKSAWNGEPAHASDGRFTASGADDEAAERSGEDAERLQPVA